MGATAGERTGTVDATSSNPSLSRSVTTSGQPEICRKADMRITRAHWNGPWAYAHASPETVERMLAEGEEIEILDSWDEEEPEATGETEDIGI